MTRISGIGSGSGPVYARTTGPGAGDMNAILEAKMRDPQFTMDQDMMFFLDLQRRMLREQQLYTMISTIMKARHDSATTAIRNFR